MRRLAALLLLGACAGTAPGPAPLSPAEQEAMAPVRRLFDGMRAGDSTAVRAAFHPLATLASVSTREGRPELRMDPSGVDGFVRAVGTPHDEVWDERVWDVVVQVDGDIATAWVPYAFHLGDTFSHCGVNAITLVRDQAGWRINQLTDTRRRDGCEVPAHAR